MDKPEVISAKVKCSEIAKDILLELMKLNSSKYIDSKYTMEEYRKIYAEIWNRI
ncbi:hypothetical protein [Morganella morganii]|uniref:hypothetical protein n=1 Tax=Morganella morganii TaxID=582 RepID=UPI00187C87FA|nr:hypothetical protein [Morganella morganii]